MNFRELHLWLSAKNAIINFFDWLLLFRLHYVVLKLILKFIKIPWLEFNET